MPEYTSIASGGGISFETSAMGKDRSPIDGATLAITKGVANLGEVLSELENRLDRFMRPSEPTPKSGETALTSIRTGSEHAESLRSHADSIEHLTRRVRDVLNRLDV